MPSGKALKIGGAWAGAATLVAAIATAVVQMRPVLADLALAESGRLELEEIRRHAIDQPVKYEIVGTSRGVVAVSIFDTGCARIASANRLRSLPSPEHEQAAVYRPSTVRAAGWTEMGAPDCRAAHNGQCALPPGHPTWAWQEVVGRDEGGWLLLDLIFEDGDRLRARYNPQTGGFVYLHWLCCVHGGG